MTRYVWFLAYKIYWWTLVVCLAIFNTNLVMTRYVWFDVGGMFWTKTFGDDDNEDDGDDDDVEVA